MGSVGTRFGRNIMPLLLINKNDTDLLIPNPRLVSRKLLTKKLNQETKVYRHLSLFVTSWIQFQTRGKPSASKWLTVKVFGFITFFFLKLLSL